MNIHININSPIVSETIADACAGQGHKIVDALVSADVVIVDNRTKVFDGIAYGKRVIQFIWNDSVESAEDLEIFNRYKGRLFIRHQDDGPYHGIGPILKLLPEISFTDR